MSNGFDFKDLLGFEKMVFPKVAKLVYLVLVGISVLFGFISLIRGIDADWGGEAMIISGLVMMTIIPLFIRLYFECILVFFKMNDKLNEIQEELSRTKDYLRR